MGLRVKNILIIFLGFILSVSIAVKSDAAWEGPTEIISGGWGSEIGQFGVSYGDSADQFPNMIVISASGKVLIGDSINKRVQVFNADGIFSNSIIPKGLPASYLIQWPLSLYICGNSNIYTRISEYLQIYNISGELAQNFTTIRGGIAFIDQQCNFYTYNPSKNLYALYSPAGQLIKTSTTRPLELGVIKEQKLGESNYKITVSYPDREYSFSLKGPYEKYIRDLKNYIYALSGKAVKKFDTCGKELGSLSTPEDQSKLVRPGGRGLDALYDLIAEYGEPIVAPNGDVYTWKRTPDKYSILKWTWVDDPNVPTGPEPPTNLTLTPSINGLYLTWKASPNDPGCVTKYEIARATTSDGVFSTIDTVEKGVLKYNDTTAEVGTTYYYKVRAMAGSDPSAYTAEVSGKR